jgi:archaemetzincin
MKKIIIIPVLLSCLFLATNNRFTKGNLILPNKVNNDNQSVVHITPLGDVDSTYMVFIKESVESFYPEIKCVIDSREELSKDILAASGKRYEASKIIRKYKTNKNILLITNSDIAYFNKEKNIKEYGIIGLGYRPGKTCVVSTYRIKRGGKTKLMDRLKKVSLHEIGHNLNIDHCKNSKDCLMHSADGTVSQIDREKIWICDVCRKSIKRLS